MVFARASLTEGAVAQGVEKGRIGAELKLVCFEFEVLVVATNYNDIGEHPGSQHATRYQLHSSHVSVSKRTLPVHPALSVEWSDS